MHVKMQIAHVCLLIVNAIPNYARVASAKGLLLVFPPILVHTLIWDSHYFYFTQREDVSLYC